MLKSIVNKYLKAFLGEVFLNAPSAHVSISADLFSDSNLLLEDLTFRPEIFDMYLKPFKLISGHLGQLNIEGITELALAGKVKFTAENIFLLFQVDTTSDAEHVQTLKKIQIEMESGKLTDSIFKELLKRIQGFPAEKEPDVVKRRKVAFKALDTIFKGLNFILKNIQFRFEIRQTTGDQISSKCYALGMIIPLIKFMPSGNAASNGSNRSSNQHQLLGADAIVLSVKRAQCYCDYGLDSFTRKGLADNVIAQEFKDRWKSDKHNMVLQPTDMEIIISLSVKRKTGLLLPQITIKSPSLRFSIDEKQLEVLRHISEAVAFTHKRFQQLLRVQKIFRNGFPLPRVFEVGGVRILPHLLIRNNPYPADSRLSAATMSSSTAAAAKKVSQSTLVNFMRERVGDRWAKMMWLHVVRLILHDLRLQRPLGRWVEVAKISHIRRKYAFIYSKLLKLSKETGNFVFDVNATVKAETLRLLFEYEMQLPVKTVLMFRALAIMIAHVELFNARRKQQQLKSNASAAGANGSSVRSSVNMQPFERVNISWTDILRIFIEHNEASRESAFHRFDRKNFDSDDSINGTVYDDASTSRASDEGSVYSYSLQSRAPLMMSPPDKPLIKQQHPVTSASSSTFSLLSSTNSHSTFSSSHISSSHIHNNGGASSPAQLSATLRNSVKSVSNMHSSALKLFGTIGTSMGDTRHLQSASGNHSSNHHSDEGDLKISSKFDLSVFSDFFNSLNETEERFNESALPEKPTHAVGAAPPKDFTKIDLQDYHLAGQQPALSTIVEAVQWVMLRHQKSVVLMPPDMNINIENVTCDFRTPQDRATSTQVDTPQREKLVSLTFSSVVANVTVSQSSHQSKGNAFQSLGTVSPIKSVRGFASLSGALLQLRMVAKQFSLSVFAERSVEEAAEKDMQSVFAQYDALVAGKSAPKGTVLSTGLPAYPVTSGLMTSDSITTSDSVKATNNGVMRLDSNVSDNSHNSSIKDNSSKRVARNKAAESSGDSEESDPEVDDDGTNVDPNLEFFAPKEARSSRIAGVKQFQYEPGKTVLENLQMQGSPEHVKINSEEEELLMMMEYHNRKLFGPTEDKLSSTEIEAVKKPNSKNSSIEVNESIKQEIHIESIKIASVSTEVESSSQKKKPEAIEPPSTGPVEKKILCSLVEDNFFVLCVILDLDDKGEGAADVQMQVGSLKSDLSRVSLSAIAHPTLLRDAYRAVTTLQQMRQLRALLPNLMNDSDDGKHALVVDRVLKVPLVSTVHISPTATMESKKGVEKMESKETLEVGDDKEVVDYISSDGDTLNGEMSDSEGGESNAKNLTTPTTTQNNPSNDKTTDIESINTQKDSGDAMQRRRQAALYNKNIHQWAGLLESYLPRVVSVCVRMSPVVVDFVESAVIRDFIFSKIHDVVDRAALRFKDGASSAQGSDHHVLSSTLQLLSVLFVQQNRSKSKNTAIRKWGSKHLHQQHLREELQFVVPPAAPNHLPNSPNRQLARSQIALPGWDLLLTKAAVPYPALDIHLQGLQVKLPVTDDTLCHLLALLLGHFFPFYY